ncbi:MAG: hypothetical protein P9M14_14125, partial [Candidatus Alcyoniella australis]|nr:hypothetical protein [Candidatus Alcyoniella australis]
LMKEDSSIIESKVPILGDIPVLGYLFKYQNRSNKKTNLVIFLTPYIIKDARDLEAVTRLRHQQFERFREVNSVPPRQGDPLPDPATFTPSPDEPTGSPYETIEPGVPSDEQVLHENLEDPEQGDKYDDATDDESAGQPEPDATQDDDDRQQDDGA